MRGPPPAAIAFLLSVALPAAACSGGSGDDGPEGLSTEPFSLDVDVGACFDRPASPDVTDLPPIDCDRPHDFEAYAVVELEGEDFPGEEETYGQGLGGCNEVFADYVGVAPGQSGLVVVPVTPSARQWEDGERTVTCTVTLRGPDRLERSVEGSEQPQG
jgi:hypothetical protein